MKMLCLQQVLVGVLVCNLAYVASGSEELQQLQQRVDALEACVDLPEPGKPKCENNLNGNITFTYTLRDWSDSDKDKLGRGRYGRLKLTPSGCYGNFDYLIGIRNYSSMDLLIQEAWLGYTFDEQSKLRCGMVQAPFPVSR